MLRSRVVIAIAVAVLAPAAASAGRAVTGTVVDDATGAPVAGALVAVGGGETATDDQGRFRIASVPFGRIEVVVIADAIAPTSARRGSAPSSRSGSRPRAAPTR